MLTIFSLKLGAEEVSAAPPSTPWMYSRLCSTKSYCQTCQSGVRVGNREEKTDGEFANLGIVDAVDLGLLGRAQAQTGDQVHDEQDEARPEERIAEARHGIRELVAELHPVAVEPAARDDREAVEVRNVVGGEEGGQDVPREPADGVHGKDVERVVGFQVVFQLGGIIARDGSHRSEDDGRPCRDVPGGRRDGDEAGDGAGTETDGGPFAFETVVEEDPGEAADGGREVGHYAGHDGTHVGSECRTTVETEPADPEEYGSDDHVGHVVRSVGKTVEITVTAPLAEHDGVGESSCSG